MKNRPSFQFYPGDFLADLNVQSMTMEERGIYITLLCHCWIEDGLPLDDEHQMAQLWKRPAVAKCFSEKNGKLRNPRLDKEKKKQEKYHKLLRERGLKGAKQRWLGHTPSNPRALPKNGSSSSTSLYKKNTFQFDSHHYSLAVFLEESVKQNVPYHKLRGDYLSAWANIFRLMEDQDKVPFDAIDEVLAWCQRDSFWQKNILSAGTFRDKFGRLAAQMKDRGTRAKPGRTGADVLREQDAQFKQLAPTERKP